MGVGQVDLHLVLGLVEDPGGGPQAGHDVLDRVAEPGAEKDEGVDNLTRGSQSQRHCSDTIHSHSHSGTNDQISLSQESEAGKL